MKFKIGDIIKFNQGYLVHLLLITDVTLDHYFFNIYYTQYPNFVADDLKRLAQARCDEIDHRYFYYQSANSNDILKGML